MLSRFIVRERPLTQHEGKPKLRDEDRDYMALRKVMHSSDENPYMQQQLQPSVPDMQADKGFRPYIEVDNSELNLIRTSTS